MKRNNINKIKISFDLKEVLKVLLGIILIIFSIIFTVEIIFPLIIFLVSFINILFQNYILIFDPTEKFFASFVIIITIYYFINLISKIIINLLICGYNLIFNKKNEK